MLSAAHRLALGLFAVSQLAGCIAASRRPGDVVALTSRTDDGAEVDLAEETAMAVVLMTIPGCTPCRPWYRLMADLRSRFPDRTQLRIIVVNVADEGDLRPTITKAGGTADIELVTRGEAWNARIGTQQVPRVLVFARGGVVQFDEGSYDEEDELYSRIVRLVRAGYRTDAATTAP